MGAALLSVLHQLSNLRKDKKTLCVGLFGYPNVGKSSIINTLKKKNVSKSTPLPGETKVWKLVTIMKRITLIDSPGVICHENQDSDTALILKGVLRLEKVEDATMHIPEVLRRIDAVCLQKIYNLSSWSNPTE